MEGKIYEAVNAVMQEVGYVQKQSGKNLSYTYASEGALIAALRPVMVKHGIMAYVMSHDELTREEYETKGGTRMTNTVIRGKVRFTHIDGSFIEVTAGGEGSDSGDKSYNKSQTDLLKYALRQTFLIETGDDPDQEPSAERTTTTRTVPTTKSKTWETFLAMAKEKHMLEPQAVQDKLKSAGFKGFDPKEWDRLEKALLPF